MRFEFIDHVDPSDTSDEVFSRVANSDVFKDYRYQTNLLYRPQLKLILFTIKLKKLFVRVSVLLLVLVATHQVTARAFAL